MKIGNVLRHPEGYVCILLEEDASEDSSIHLVIDPTGRTTISEYTSDWKEWFWNDWKVW